MSETPTNQGAPLRGQTALVTGASRGLGRAIARRLAQEGAAVCCNYLARAADAEALVRFAPPAAAPWRWALTSATLGKCRQ